MIPQKTIDTILSTVHIESYIGGDIELKKAGVNHQGCCPFHNEKTPSFSVSSARGIFKCFGCGEGGNVIKYVMLRESMTFPEAVKHLAKRYNIEFEEREQTPEEREAGFKRESIHAVNDTAVKYYIDNLRKNKAAMKYLLKRWNKETIEDMQIGYAGEEWDGLKNHTIKAQHTEQTLLDAGLLSRSEKTGGTFDFFRERIMIPIRSWNGHVVGFTARAMNDKGPKYMNTRETLVFNKSRNLYGISEAMRVSKSTDRMNLVEGAPDVIRLQSIGITNTVAPLGTALTKEQVDQIKRCCKNVVMIPDVDAAGLKAALKNGELLFKEGLNVSVLLINDGTDSNKGKDPDEYFKVKQDYEEALEKNTMDYILWVAAAEMDGVSNESERGDKIGKICKLLATQTDASTIDMYIESLSKLYKPKKVWATKLVEAQTQRDIKEQRSNNKDIDDVFQKFGFFVKNNSYEGPGQRGGTIRWSNFTMTPLAHVRSMMNSKRLYRIKNCYNHEQTIEVKQEDLVSLAKFRVRTESMGNFLWEAGEIELHKLKRYLYENTLTCDEITQLGWQKKHGFFAWGNGGVVDGQFIKANDIGILTIQNNNYYLPAFSKIFENETNLFQFERQFAHSHTNGISLHDYSDLLISVFGDNGKIALCFLLATLFKDVVTRHTKSFPLLNLFGPKGTGKSELGHSLTSFFVTKNTPPNINTTTKPALGEAVAQVSNAVVHLDEYKNTIEFDRLEFLKGLWDGTGRTKMNMERDKKRETTAVDAGVVISGQEMPTADNALFSRLVFLTFNQTEFSDKERRKFEELKRIEDRGMSHLTNDLLRHRNAMEVNYAKEWNACSEEMGQTLTSHAIEDRTFKNWVTLVAALRTMAPLIHLPFTAIEVTEIARKGIISQNDKTKQNNELSGFWETIETLVRNVQVIAEVDYKIKGPIRPISLYKHDKKVELDMGKRYLFLNFNGVVSLYLKECKATGAKQLPKDSLRYYLENSPEYIGVKKSERFKQLAYQGSPNKVSQAEPLGGGTKYDYQVTTCMVFDYEAIVSRYGVNIDRIAMTENDAEEEE